MYFRILGNKIEYTQAAKRLEQISGAAPNTLEAQELKELIRAFTNYEKDIQQLRKKQLPGGIDNFEDNS
ncbi:MAG: hypothetical protein JWQ14_3636 [Adhaeribacter sp.]|nr:hypothetical protein [Adhaeribacter sp.]